MVTGGRRMIQGNRCLRVEHLTFAYMKIFLFKRYMLLALKKIFSSFSPGRGAI